MQKKNQNNNNHTQTHMTCFYEKTLSESFHERNSKPLNFNF